MQSRNLDYCLQVVEQAVRHGNIHVPEFLQLFARKGSRVVTFLVGVLQPLISAFTKPGGVVLDPFCGSGSTLVAARDLDRNYIGIELDPEHHGTASRRLAGS